MATRLAVIDLGSNTFHLLIAEKTAFPPYFRKLHKEREFIYISSEGLSHIPDEKVSKSLEALSRFRKTIERFQCDQIIAIGTAALRSADNGKYIVDKMYETTGISIQLISGKQEAQLIFEGTQCMQYDTTVSSLVMDIGGGSVEFIFQKHGKMLGSHSFNTGISVLRKLGILSDPPDRNQILELFDWLDNEMSELKYDINRFQPELLIGSSGPFEILESIKLDKAKLNGNIYEKADVAFIAQKIIGSDLKERLAIDGMPVHRADLAMEAFLLIEFMLSRYTNLRKILVSPFAIKEGLIRRAFNTTND